VQDFNLHKKTHQISHFRRQKRDEAQYDLKNIRSNLLAEDSDTMLAAINYRPKTQ